MTSADAAPLTEEELRNAYLNLSRAGIGSRYHKKSLKDYGDVGRRLYSIDATELRAEARAGNGISLFGGTIAHDIFMILAKDHAVCGVTVRVVSLSVLASEVLRDTVDQRIQDCQALFVTPFFRPDYPDALTGPQRLAIEDFVMERLDSSRAFFTVASSPIAHTGQWWSKFFRERLMQLNTEIEVK